MKKKKIKNRKKKKKKKKKVSIKHGVVLRARAKPVIAILMLASSQYLFQSSEQIFYKSQSL